MCQGILNCVKNLAQVDRNMGLVGHDVEPLLRGQRDLLHDQRRQVFPPTSKKTTSLNLCLDIQCKQLELIIRPRNVDPELLISFVTSSSSFSPRLGDFKVNEFYNI